VVAEKDPNLDVLLDLDGQAFVDDPAGPYWFKFRVTRGPPTSLKPHGLDYSLTLYGPSGDRLLGFANVHGVGRRISRRPRDHRHRVNSVQAYAYRDAAGLLEDIWKVVDSVLRDQGVIK